MFPEEKPLVSKDMNCKQFESEFAVNLHWPVPSKEGLLLKSPSSVHTRRQIPQAQFTQDT